jgi:hypothetical protein
MDSEQLSGCLRWIKTNNITDERQPAIAAEN